MVSRCALLCPLCISFLAGFSNDFHFKGASSTALNEYSKHQNKQTQQPRPKSCTPAFLQTFRGTQAKERHHRLGNFPLEVSHVSTAWAINPRPCTPSLPLTSGVPLTSLSTQPDCQLPSSGYSALAGIQCFGDSSNRTFCPIFRSHLRSDMSDSLSRILL